DPARAEPLERLLESLRPDPISLDREGPERSNEDAQWPEKQGGTGHIIQRPFQEDAEDQDVEVAQVIGDQHERSLIRDILPTRRAEPRQRGQQSTEIPLDHAIP